MSSENDWHSGGEHENDGISDQNNDNELIDKLLSKGDKDDTHITGGNDDMSVPQNKPEKLYGKDVLLNILNEKNEEHASTEISQRVLQLTNSYRPSIEQKDSYTQDEINEFVVSLELYINVIKIDYENSHSSEIESDENFDSGLDSIDESGIDFDLESENQLASERGSKKKERFFKYSSAGLLSLLGLILGIYAVGKIKDASRYQYELHSNMFIVKSAQCIPDNDPAYTGKNDHWVLLNLEAGRNLEPNSTSNDNSLDDIDILIPVDGIEKGEKICGHYRGNEINIQSVPPNTGYQTQDGIRRYVLSKSNIYGFPDVN